MRNAIRVVAVAAATAFVLGGASASYAAEGTTATSAPVSTTAFTPLPAPDGDETGWGEPSCNTRPVPAGCPVQ
ncbi:hypothetical protein ACFCV8_05740 [Streptomyces sp. NPDC056347]|uniref:hypothetical protein n=1 Tax=Streptomyces sp. NPDC056347 TaxID=3345790 RepID=UPI0035E35F9B